MRLIELCCEQLNFVLPSSPIASRRDKFINSDSPRINLLSLIACVYLSIHCDLAYMSRLITGSIASSATRRYLL